jgi:hypothetical protein
VNFAQLEGIFNQWLYLDHDKDLLRALVSIYCANRYDGPPVWVMLIGKAGCGKSEILSALAGHEKTVMISKITANTLATGFGDGSESLLYKLKDNKVMVIKDMSTITEMSNETKTQIFSDLRDSFDGSFVKHTGTGSKVEFKGKFGIIAGATEGVERSRMSETSLGERFLYYRIRLTDSQETEIQHRSAGNVSGYTKMREDLMRDMDRFLKSVKLGHNTKISKVMMEDIFASARFLAKARSHVSRDRFSREIDAPVESTEVPTRVTAQLLLIGIACQEVTEGTEDDVRRIVYRVCLDSMPGIRLRVIRSIVAGNETSDEISKHIQMSSTTVKRYLEELQFLGVIRTDKSKWSLIDDHAAKMMKVAFA